jgi:hypothetical protein
MPAQPKKHRSIRINQRKIVKSFLASVPASRLARDDEETNRSVRAYISSAGRAIRLLQGL